MVQNIVIYFRRAGFMHRYDVCYLTDREINCGNYLPDIFYKFMEILTFYTQLCLQHVMMIHRESYVLAVIYVYLQSFLHSSALTSCVSYS